MGMLMSVAGCSTTGTSSDDQIGNSTPAKGELGADATIAGVEAALPPEAVQQFEKALVLMSAGDSVAAQQALSALAQTYPTYAGPSLNLGILNARAGQLDAAEQALKTAIERDATSAVAFNQLGIVYRRQGRFGEAETAYQRAIELDPNYANAHLNLGVLCDLYLQQPQRALEAYERYLALATAPDQRVSAWVTELKTRLGNQARSARAES
jgi:tetratricopeptide (TPR) repeat protein